MLSDLDLKHQLHLNMADAGTTTPHEYDLEFLGSPEFPWQMKNISGLITSGPTINFANCEVKDENGNQIYITSLLPWGFANTTPLVHANQSPDVISVQFLGPPPIIGGIPADFYVYSNWTITVNLFQVTVGSAYDLTAIFMQGYFRDKYRLSA